MGKDVLLLDYWPSMFGMRVRIALDEKGVDYEYRDEDLLWNKSDLLLQMNPVHKKIPVLVHNGRPVCESLIILEYIDEVWNAKSPLMPADPYERAQARFWADYADKKIYDAGRRIWSTKGEEQQKAKNDLIEALKVLEDQALGDKPYFAGDGFGFMDLALVTYYTWFYSYETEAKFKLEDSCPRLIAWVKRCLARETVAKNLPNPHKIYNFMFELKKKFGIEC